MERELKLYMIVRVKSWLKQLLIVSKANEVSVNPTK